MKIIEQTDCFEVISDDGETKRKFYFDDNASRRAISGKVTKKRAFIEAKTFAGKGAVILGPLRPAGSADRYKVPKATE